MLALGAVDVVLALEVSACSPRGDKTVCDRLGDLWHCSRRKSNASLIVEVK